MIRDERYLVVLFRFLVGVYSVLFHPLFVDRGPVWRFLFFGSLSVGRVHFSRAASFALISWGSVVGLAGRRVVVQVEHSAFFLFLMMMVRLSLCGVVFALDILRCGLVRDG